MTLVLLVLACGLLGVIIEQALTYTQRRLGRSKPSAGRPPASSGKRPAQRADQRPAPRADKRPAQRTDKRPAKRGGREAAWPNQVEVVGPPFGPADSWPGLAPVYASAPNLTPVPEPVAPPTPPAPTRQVTGVAPGQPTVADRLSPEGEKSEFATQTMVPEASKTVVVPLPVLCGQPQGPAGRSPRRSAPTTVAKATEKTGPEQTVWTAVTGRIPRVK